MTDQFPTLAGAEIAAKRDKNGAPFMVVAMFTASHRKYADRLKASLDKLKLNYALFQVPGIHRSISAKGSDDIAFSKPSFIHHALTEFGMPLLYLDSDIVVRARPVEIEKCVAEGVDFAIYNWLADEANDCYVPVDVGGAAKGQFYRYSHSIDLTDTTQLMCSGAAQFYANTDAARQMLSLWLGAIRQHPGIDDDPLLDYSFNILRQERPVKTAWLDKSYCRYGWWIQTKPVIDHPDLPAAGDGSRSFRNTGKPRFNEAGVREHPPQGPFPRDCFIDVKRKQLMTPVGTTLMPLRSFDNPIWVP